MPPRMLHREQRIWSSLYRDGAITLEEYTAGFRPILAASRAFTPAPPSPSAQYSLPLSPALALPSEETFLARLDRVARNRTAITIGEACSEMGELTTEDNRMRVAKGLLELGYASTANSDGHRLFVRAEAA